MNIFDIAYYDPSSFGEPKLKLTMDSPYSLVVPKNFPAVDAVRIAEMNKLGVICVVGSPGDAKVEGLVAVDWVSGQIRRNKATRFSLLSEALAQIELDPAEIARNYHHEWLNYERPGLDWCNVHGHLTLLPCPWLK